MSKILVCGHQNPDTDSIVSAISFAAYLTASGKEAEAVALGAPSEETQFALDAFGFAAPRIIEGVEADDMLALVDHNEAQQSVPGREKATIVSVVDHHRIANFETAAPLFYRAEPVGCSNTIIYQLFQESGYPIEKNLAGLMLSAIVSDTLLKKSPTCTPKDEQALDALAAIAGVDVDAYGLDLLKAGTNLANRSNETLLNLDAKNFPMGDASVRIAQVNTVDVDEVLARKAELLKVMEAEIQKEGHALFVLLITNILTSDTTALVAGAQTDKMVHAFDAQIVDDVVALKGVVSRKKQVVPPLTKAFEG